MAALATHKTDGRQLATRSRLFGELQQPLRTLGGKMTAAATLFAECAAPQHVFLGTVIRFVAGLMAPKTEGVGAAARFVGKGAA
jgi:hypothetical protein